MTAALCPIRFVAFDLDGTLIRGDTCAEALARSVGQLERMRAFEQLTDLTAIAVAREEMAGWYGAPRDGLDAALASLTLAPGVEEGFRLLRRRGVVVGIVSITWEFAVAWFARRLDADCWAGTTLSPDGRIGHFWPEDKARWLAVEMARRGLRPEEVAAVGDSWGDVPLLRAAGRRYFVGARLPDDLDGIEHLPAGHIGHIARLILA